MSSRWNQKGTLLRTEQRATDEPALHGFVWFEVLATAEDTETTVVTTEVLQPVVAAATRVAKVHRTLRACHVIASRSPLDVCLQRNTQIDNNIDIIYMYIPATCPGITLISTGRVSVL